MELNMNRSKSDITYKSELILAGYFIHKQPGLIRRRLRLQLTSSRCKEMLRKLSAH